MGGDHACSLCGATFTRPQHVSRHMRSHTGERPYPCTICSESFSRSDLLARHQSKCHPEHPLPPRRGGGKRGPRKNSNPTASTSAPPGDGGFTATLPLGGVNFGAAPSASVPPYSSSPASSSRRTSEDVVQQTIVNEYGESPYAYNTAMGSSASVLSPPSFGTSSRSGSGSDSSASPADVSNPATPAFSHAEPDAAPYQYLGQGRGGVPVSYLAHRVYPDKAVDVYGEPFYSLPDGRMTVPAEPYAPSQYPPLPPAPASSGWSVPHTASRATSESGSSSVAPSLGRQTSPIVYPASLPRSSTDLSLYPPASDQSSTFAAVTSYPPTTASFTAPVTTASVSLPASSSAPALAMAYSQAAPPQTAGAYISHPDPQYMGQHQPRSEYGVQHQQQGQFPTTPLAFNLPISPMATYVAGTSSGAAQEVPPPPPSAFVSSFLDQLALDGSLSEPELGGYSYTSFPFAAPVDAWQGDAEEQARRQQHRVVREMWKEFVCEPLTNSTAVGLTPGPGPGPPPMVGPLGEHLESPVAAAPSSRPLSTEAAAPASRPPIPTPSPSFTRASMSAIPSSAPLEPHTLAVTPRRTSAPVESYSASLTFAPISDPAPAPSDASYPIHPLPPLPPAPKVTPVSAPRQPPAPPTQMHQPSADASVEDLRAYERACLTRATPVLRLVPRSWKRAGTGGASPNALLNALGSTSLGDNYGNGERGGEAPPVSEPTSALSQHAKRELSTPYDLADVKRTAFSLHTPLSPPDDETLQGGEGATSRARGPSRQLFAASLSIPSALAGPSAAPSPEDRPKALLPGTDASNARTAAVAAAAATPVAVSSSSPSS